MFFCESMKMAVMLYLCSIFSSLGYVDIYDMSSVSRVTLSKATYTREQEKKKDNILATVNKSI